MVKSHSDTQVGMRWSMRHAVLACSLLCGVGMLSVNSVSAQSADNQLMQKEIRKRSENRILAKQMLVEGDQQYNAKKYAEAVESYSKAFSLLPKAGLTGEMRFVAADRYAQASVERAKYLAKHGDIAGAKKLLEVVLADDVAPGHQGALILSAQVDDPIKYNPVLTPEHVKNIQAVGQWLRKAEGYYELGQFDEALVAYEEVIRIDAHNKAARRGMERVTVAMSGYSRAAYDQTRSKLLSDTDAAWEIPANTVTDLRAPVGGGAGDQPEMLSQEIAGRKLDQILIPMVDFADISLEEAIDTMRQWAREFDVSELDETRRGVNFVTRLGDATTRNEILGKRINLQLRNVPLSQVLDFVTKATGTRWRSDTFGVAIIPSGMRDTVIRNRTFRVPPAFMQDAVSGEGEADDDVFDTGGNDGNTVLKPKLSAMEYLKRVGVTFPEGSTASYIRGANTLSVANTETNLSLIEEYLRTLRQKESVQVVVNLTVIDIAQENLEELGYDWLIGQNSLSSTDNLFIGGGTQGSGSIVPTTIGGVDPITSGNRSGAGAYPEDSINRLLDGRELIGSGGSLSQPRAPGVLSVTGQLNQAGVEAVLRGLNQKKDDTRVFKPSVIARPGEKASVFSGQVVLVPTEYEPPELPNQVGIDGGASPVTPSTPTAFDPRELGFKFEIEPTVSEDRNYIELALNPEYRELDGFINYGSPIQSLRVDAITGETIPTVVTTNAILMPIFSVIRMNTSVTVQDGATVVVGGLHQVKIDEVNDSVPVLGDLPFIGRFFQTKGYRHNKRAIIIMVNAKLVDPTGRAWKDR